MMRPALWLWLLLWTVLTGCAITALLLVPGIEDSLALYILGAAVACGILSIPISRALGRAMLSAPPSARERA